jgi:hypothetical protein
LQIALQVQRHHTLLSPAKTGWLMFGVVERVFAFGCRCLGAHTAKRGAHHAQVLFKLLTNNLDLKMISKRKVDGGL